MKPNTARRLALGCVIALLLLSPLVSGCAQVQVTDEKAEDESTPTPYGVVAWPAEDHDLAILGIEFSPPLRFADVIAAGKLTLLVALENRGNSRESDVIVEARLVDSADVEIIPRRSQQLASMGPGEVKLVRFEDLAFIPYRPAYVMTVSVLPVPGEVRTIDNQRSYRFQLIVPTPTLPGNQ